MTASDTTACLFCGAASPPAQPRARARCPLRSRARRSPARARARGARLQATPERPIAASCQRSASRRLAQIIETLRRVDRAAIAAQRPREQRLAASRQRHVHVARQICRRTGRYGVEECTPGDADARVHQWRRDAAPLVVRRTFEKALDAPIRIRTDDAVRAAADRTT